MYFNLNHFPPFPSLFLPFPPSSLHGTAQGAIFTARFCPDSPFLLAVGGEKDGLRVLSLERVADGRWPTTGG